MGDYLSLSLALDELYKFYTLTPFWTVKHKYITIPVPRTLHSQTSSSPAPVDSAIVLGHHRGIHLARGDSAPTDRWTVFPRPVAVPVGCGARLTGSGGQPRVSVGTLWGTVKGLFLSKKLLGWKPLLLGWRPSILGWRPSLLVARS